MRTRIRTGTDSSCDCTPDFSLQSRACLADTFSMDAADPFFAPLIARRVAIAGFEPAEEARLNELFRAAGASCRSYHAGALQLAIRRCDVALVAVDQLGPLRVESFPKPVIAGITPDSLRQYSQWIKNAAFDWFFCPGTSDELLTRVTVALQNHPGPKRSNLGRAFCILLADDDPFCRDLFRLMLQGQDMVFRAVEDGRKAVEVARDWRPDLVVLDVNMPGLDGFEALSALKDDQTTKEIPIIMLTASHESSEILRGLKLGAKDYVVKPFEPAAVVERIRQLRTQKYAVT